MKRFFLLLLVFVCGVVVFSACKDDDDNLTYDNLNDLINSVNVFAEPVSFSRTPNNLLEGDGYMQRDLDTSANKWIVNIHAPIKFTQRFEETVNLNANQSDIYPGSIVQGGELINGRAISIGDNFSRKPVTITMANGGNSVFVNNPSYSSVSNAMNELVSQQKPIPAIMNYEIVNCYSSEQSLAEFGMNIGWGFLSASAMYQENTNTKQNSVMLYFRQTYYTMTIGNNRNATDIFSENVNVNQLATKTSDGNPLCVINEVDYGRIILVKVTSTESYEEITAKIKAGIKFIGGSFQTSTSSFNSSYEFKAHIIGGKASDAARVVDGIDAVFDIIKRGADYADGNPGFPIAYRASYLKNGNPVLTGKTIYYSEISTEELKGEFRFTFGGIVFNKIGWPIFTPAFGIRVGSWKYDGGEYGWYNQGDTLKFNKSTEWGKLPSLNSIFNDFGVEFYTIMNCSASSIEYDEIITSLNIFQVNHMLSWHSTGKITSLSSSALSAWIERTSTGFTNVSLWSKYNDNGWDIRMLLRMEIR